MFWSGCKIGGSNHDDSNFLRAVSTRHYRRYITHTNHVYNPKPNPFPVTTDDQQMSDQEAKAYKIRKVSRSFFVSRKMKKVMMHVHRSP